MRGVKQLRLGDRGSRIEGGFNLDSHPVNTKDRGRCKKRTYMGPAWTRDQEGSVAQQGESMSTSQQVDYLLD